MFRRVFPLVAAFFGLLLCPCVWGSSPQSSSESAFEVMVDNGILFSNQRFVPSPYEIVATNDGVRINGRLFTSSDLLIEDDEAEFSVPRERGGEFPDSTPNTVFAASNSSDAFSQDGAAAFPADYFRPGGGRGGVKAMNRFEANVEMARRLAASLEAGQIVVMFPNSESRVMMSRAEEYDLLTGLLSPDLTDDELSRFLALAPSINNADWRAWRASFTPPAAIQKVLADRLSSLVAVETGNLRQNAAVRRLDRYSYPLTIIAMLLGVGGLGHILKWSAAGLDRGSLSGPTAELDSGQMLRAGNFVKGALALMAAMAIVDLLWTILAAQAGIMREVNPFAVGLIRSPAALAAFKCVAMAVSLTIFYRWRTVPLVQQATWWMCLVCILLTFRWVVVDSLVG